MAVDLAMIGSRRAAAGAAVTLGQWSICPVVHQTVVDLPPSRRRVVSADR
jgi:hypothetical protein